MNALGEAERVAHWLTLVPARVKAGVLLALAGLAAVAAWNYHERDIGAVQCLADQEKVSHAAELDHTRQVATIKTLEQEQQPELAKKFDELKAKLPQLRANVAAPPAVINKVSCEYPKEAIDAYNAIR